MLDNLRRQVAVEFEQLDKLIVIHRPLLDKCEKDAPTDIELSALAAMMHSFYTGIENILKRVAVELDGDLSTGRSWHRELLDSMSEPSALRGAVLSAELRHRLEEYLKFRHFFRHAYSFQFDWEKLSSLVLACETTLHELEKEMNTFFGRVE